jgi:hypothetical protein
VTDDPDRAAWLRQARAHLRTAHPVLARLIDDRPAFDPRAWLAQLPPAVYERARAGREGRPSDPKPDVADRAGLPARLARDLRGTSAGS